MTMLDYALAAARRGWHVFPVRPHTKQPDGLLAPNGQDDATTDESVIRRWFATGRALNYGIHCAPSGLYVVDVDVAYGKKGEETWAKHVAEHGHVDTFTVRSPSGGRHFYYLMPDTPLANSGGTKLGEGIDSRGNGYVVGPGSTLGSEKYIVEDKRDPVALPEWIVEACTPPMRTYVPSANAEKASEIEVVSHIAELATQLRDALDGEGNETASRVAAYCGSYVGAGQIGEQYVLAALFDAIKGWTWRHSEDFKAMERTIESQVQWGIAHPREWKATASVYEPDVVSKAEEKDQPPTDWASDHGQARYLRDLTRRTLIHVPNVGWYRWMKTHWQKMEEDYVRQVAMNIYEKKFKHYADLYAKTGDEKYPIRAKAYKTFMSSSKLTGIIKSWSHTPGVLVDVSQLDSYPELLNTPEGIVNLRTGVVDPHDAKKYFTRITRGSYRPDDEFHEDWKAVLSALDEETVSYLQLRMGQAITGYIPESDDAIFLTGRGSNGKTAYTTDGVFQAIGDYALLANPNLVAIKDGGGGATPERAALHGARFVLIEELAADKMLNIAEIKRITGTPMITARFLYGKDFTFRATHTLFVTANQLPLVNDTDTGAWRRLLRIYFPYEYVGTPTLAHHRKGDPGLRPRLSGGRDGQHDSIVTWLVRGAMAYLADVDSILPDNRPSTVERATDEWRQTADRVLGFIRDRLVPEEGAMIARTDLYADFTGYLTENGHSRWSSQSFFGKFLDHSTVASAGAYQTRTRNAAACSRPPSVVGELQATVPQVIVGFRFKRKDEE